MRTREGERDVQNQAQSLTKGAHMKLAAFDHPKTLLLKSLLKCSYPAVIGHMELLWKFTAQHAPRGNLGKWPDAAIAGACSWEGEATVFVEALVESGYVKRDRHYRLLVHDWHEHCPQWVRAQLAKANVSFTTLSVATEEPSLVSTEEPSSEPSTIPSQAKPSLTKNAPMRARERDLLWEAMLEACGIPAAKKPTKPERAAWNAALKALKDVGATPDLIRARGKAFRRKWPTSTLTPSALARRWTECISDSLGERHALP